jgi:hypothetical protein
MLARGRWPRIVVPALLLLAATSIPYILAATRQPPGFVFGGFLLNPVDGFSYLAKMREGADGAWLFRLPFAPEPGAGAFLFVYYLLLGHLSRLLGVGPLVVFHLARAIGVMAMVAAAGAFLDRFVPEGHGRTWAWRMTLVGSGWGWAALPAGILALDLWVPEAIPALSAYASAHFPLSMALLWFGGLCIFPGLRGRSRLLISFACGAALSLIQPFAAGTLIVVSSGWIAIEAWSGKGRRGEGVGDSLGALAAFGIGAAPVLAYDGFVVLTHPALREWNRQNLTPTPGVWETVLAFLPLLALAALAMAKRESWSSSRVRFLAAWGLVNLALLYAPLGLQRRFVLGASLPLAALGALGVETLAPGRRWLATAALLLTLPSHLVVVGAGLTAALTQDPALVMTRDEAAGYQWLADHAPAGALVLAGERDGNHIPAFADARVVYGHPFETPYADQEKAWVRAVFGWTGDASGLVTALRARGVDFVFVGAEERALGRLDWLSSLDLEYQSGEVAIYRIRKP